MGNWFEQPLEDMEQRRFEPPDCEEFEWQFGYSKKFGFLSVDFGDEQRSRAMKPLAEIYRRVCRENAVGH